MNDVCMRFSYSQTGSTLCRLPQSKRVPALSLALKAVSSFELLSSGLAGEISWPIKPSDVKIVNKLVSIV